MPNPTDARPTSKRKDRRKGVTASPIAPSPIPAGPIDPQSPIGAFRRERWWLLALCLLAAMRIFFGAASLPFFANTDEDAHFDLVYKLARNFWPDEAQTPFDNDTLKYLIFHSSPEFLNQPGDPAQGPAYLPPVRDRLSDPKTQGFIRYQYEHQSQRLNHEAYEPPLYYELAAIWLGIGGTFKLSEPASVYWVRFLNVLLFAALVAGAYAFCRPYLGRDTAFAVAALTALFPNTVFFIISNDVMSPLVVVVTLLLLLRWVTSERPLWWLAPAAGAMAAACLLVKLSNASALVAVAFAIVLRARHGRGLKRALLESRSLLFCVALPLFFWALRNRLVLGTWSGTEGRLLVRGLTRKPLGEWLDHPFFNSYGLLTFLNALGISFFRGDVSWNTAIVRFPPAEVFFQITALLLPVIGIASVFFFAPRERKERLAAGMATVVVVAAVGQLAFMSILFNFPGDDFPPSKSFPFYAFGRLASGAIVPFFVLYALGIRALVFRRTAWFAAGVLVADVMMALSQWEFVKRTVSSQYNWFHLP